MKQHLLYFVDDTMKLTRMNNGKMIELISGMKSQMFNEVKYK